MAAYRPVKRWIHVSEDGGDPWVLPIWAAANSAMIAGRVNKLTNRLSELGVHISTRLNLLPRVIRRINEEAVAVGAAVAARPPGHECSRGVRAWALRLDKTLKFQLLIDVDSLLFELNSLYELWCEFFKALHIHTEKDMPANTASASIRQVITDGGGDASWVDELNRERNYFTHRGAPYLAIDVSRAEYDLLFLKSNVVDLNVSKDYVRLTELNSMIQKFRRSKSPVADYLSGLFTR